MNNNVIQTALELASLIDHTNLKPFASKKDIVKLCREADKYGFYSVCVQPYFVSRAVEQLVHSSVKVSAVVGFPLGGTSWKVKSLEALECFKAGADELDIVINLGAVKSKEFNVVRRELEMILNKTPTCVHKIIVEISLLNRTELKEVMKIINELQPAFVKTSTGTVGVPTEVKDVKALKKLVTSSIGIKAAGGIRSFMSVLELAQAGASRIGTSAGVEIIQNFLKCQSV